MANNNYDSGRNRFTAGIGAVGSYQVSGKPWVTGSLDVNTLANNGDPAFEIEFPSVTRWIMVRNHDAQTSDSVKVAFSPTGYETNNFFTLNGRASAALYSTDVSIRMELKITKLYLSGSSSKVDVVAGLTGISNEEILNSWSGSAGVG